jgi:outer membrane protein assembly factor BamB
MIIRGLICIFWILSVPFISLSDGQVWTQFRGQGGQGHSDASNLPVSWNSEKNIRWKLPVPGSGWSSPVFDSDILVLTSAVQQQSVAESYWLTVFGIDPETGNRKWTTPVFSLDEEAPGIHRKNGHASPTPLLEGDRIYVHFGHMGIACIDKQGRVLWRNQKLAYRPVHGSGGSPILAGDKLIFNCDGGRDPFIVALYKKSGKVAWRVSRQTDARKTFSFCTPLLISVNGQTQVISPGSNVVNALNPDTGQSIWQVRYDGFSVVPRPVFDQGLLFLSSGFERPVLLAIRPDGRGDVTDTKVVWTSRRSVPKTSSFLSIDKELYTFSDNGIATCYDARTGEIHWNERIGGDYSASPIYADGRIYVTSEDGKTVVLQPGRKFQKITENEFHERTLSSIAVTSGALFLRTEHSLYRIEKL